MISSILEEILSSFFCQSITWTDVALFIFTADLFIVKELMEMSIIDLDVDTSPVGVENGNDNGDDSFFQLNGKYDKCLYFL